MINTIYANAYKEVHVILEYLVEDDRRKIPKEYIEFFKNNCNNEYEFDYDKSKTLEEQQLLKETKYILFGMFEKFGATKKQQERILTYKRNYFIKKESEKREYNYNNDIFKQRNDIKGKTNSNFEQINMNNNLNSDYSNVSTVNNEALIEYKGNTFLKRLIRFLKKIFK